MLWSRNMSQTLTKVVDVVQFGMCVNTFFGVEGGRRLFTKNKKSDRKTIRGVVNDRRANIYAAISDKFSLFIITQCTYQLHFAYIMQNYIILSFRKRPRTISQKDNSPTPLKQ